MLRRALGTAHHASLRPAARAFEKALADPASAQEQRRQTILTHLAPSRHARAIGAKAGMGLEEFQRLPVATYAGMAPWIERAAAGEANVLSPAPIRMFERSGGSAGPSKLLPFTEPFLAEMRASTAAWMWDLQRAPDLRHRPSYWSLSPVSTASRTTPGGIPIGADDDASYFGPLAAWAIRRMMAVPGGVARIQEAGAWRRATLRHLVNCPELGLVSVWSPSFLTLLLEHLQHDSTLLAGLSPRRRSAVEERVRNGTTRPEALWPHLRVSCWTHGPSGQDSLLGALRSHLPTTPIQPKGLLAVEGVVSVPWLGDDDPFAAGTLRAGPDPVLAVASHFLEFLEPGRPDREPRLAHELQSNTSYSPLLTTSAGLIRYHLPDQVRCTGRLDSTPTIRFEGRLDGVTDMCGEKVSESAAGTALRLAAAACHVTPRFAMLVPDLDPPRYVLVVEGVGAPAASRMAQMVDVALRAAHPYDHCRHLGQLGVIAPQATTDGWHRLLELRRKQGTRIGEVKPMALGRIGWLRAFK